MEVRLLGPVELVDDVGTPIALQGTKMRGLVAVLALDAGRTVTTGRIMEALWGEDGVSGANVVQVLVSKLRRALAEAGYERVIATRPSGYLLDVEPAIVDASFFEGELAAARAVRADPVGCLARLEEGLRSWRGEPLGGVPDTGLILAMRARLSELRHGALEDRAELRLGLGRHNEVVSDLESLVVEEPLRERRWALLVRALYASGRQADAIRAYQRARDVLIEEIGAEPGPELRRLEAAILAQDDAALVVPVATAAPVGEGFRRKGNFAYPVGDCIGRAKELDEIVSALRRRRLVTLTGPGGVGKTRLAQEVGVHLVDSVSEGVWWVDLVAARGTNDVVAALHRALGIDGGPVADVDSGVAAVAGVLADRDVVFVFDNCEHLVAGVAAVVGSLLGACRGLRVVATSRERLGVVAEVCFELQPLGGAAAVELFELAASAAVDAAGAAVLGLCDRLDRLPLAIELAAARTRYFTVAEITAGLSEFVRTEGAPVRGLAEHQRSLHAVASWSYALLDDAEQVVFERLSVFSDGATLAAAADVCAACDIASDEVESILHRLVDKSLVVADRTDRTRFRMLQTLADFASDRLHERGADHDTRRAHARWVCSLARTVAFGQRTDGATVASVQVEDAAIRDAVEWALQHEPNLALEICTSLAAFWFGTMRVSHGWELLSRSLAATANSDDLALRASAKGWAAVFATMVQEPDAALRFADEALAFERTLGDPMRLGVVTLMMMLASGYRNDGQWARWQSESRGHFADAGLASGNGHASFAEGAVHLLAGDGERAAACLRKAIAAFREHSDHLGLILATSRLGELALRTGDVTSYAELHADLLELGLQARSTGVIAGATARLGHARLLLGDVAEAEGHARDALAASSASFMPVVTGYVQRTAGLVNLRLGHTEEGRAQLAAAIDAFSHGAGGLGLGQAAMVWLDVSQSFAGEGDRVRAVDAVDHARRAADQAREPWVSAQVDAHRARLADGASPGHGA